MHGRATENQSELARLKFRRGLKLGQIGKTALLQYRRLQFNFSGGGLELQPLPTVPKNGLIGQRYHPLFPELFDGDPGILQLIAPDILNSLKVEIVAGAQTAGQFLKDPPGRTGVQSGCHGLVPHGNPRFGAALADQDVGPLEIGGLGQDHIGQPTGFTVIDINGDQQFQLFERSYLGFRIRKRGERIVAIGNIGPYRIRVPGFQGRKELMQETGPGIEVLVFPARPVHPLSLPPGD